MLTYTSPAAARAALVSHGPAILLLPINGRPPVRIVANDTILAGFDDKVMEQIVNAAEMPGAEQVVIGADAHVGFGVCVGTTVISSTHVYPPVIGPDCACSMSFLQTDVPEAALKDKPTRRALINAILDRIPTGLGNRQAPKARRLIPGLLRLIAEQGASATVLDSLSLPRRWATKCELPTYGREDELRDRLHWIVSERPELLGKLSAVGSLGGGNHFLSGDMVDLKRDTSIMSVAETFGLHHGRFGTLTHCGSRGFGYQLMAYHAKRLQAHYDTWGIPYTGGDNHMVCAPIGTPEAYSYMLDVALAANFAIVNHLLINAYVLEAVQEVLPGATGDLVYHISHNVGQQEIIGNARKWVFRKGATRAFAAGHPQLRGTPYQDTGHPILLPGNARDGSVIMVAAEGANATFSTVNHGAGRSMGRKQAKRMLVQAEVDANLAASDVMHNGRAYPLDEAPGAYKDFDEVTRCVEQAGLATTVARLRPTFVIKDNDQSAEGAA